MALARLPFYHRAMLRSLGAVSFVALATLVGCGGATVSDLFEDAAAPDSAVADTSVPKDTGIPDVIGVDVPILPPNDAGPVDAGPPDVGPPTASILCGKTLASAALKCDANKEVCCRSGSGVNLTVKCTTDSDTNCKNDADLPLSCSTNATCNALGLVNNVCCGTRQNNSVVSSACVPANQCSLQNGDVLLCDVSLPNICPQGTTCKTSVQTLPGYDLCF